MWVPKVWLKGATVEVDALTSGGFKDTSFMLSVVC
jgi:hypothetical protein